MHMIWWCCALTMHLELELAPGEDAPATRYPGWVAWTWSRVMLSLGGCPRHAKRRREVADGESRGQASSKVEGVA